MRGVRDAGGGYVQEVLNLIHVGGAVLWVGAALFVYLFVTPAARAAGEGAGPFMGALLRGRLSTVMTVASIATVASGIWLWVRRFEGAPSSDFSGAALSIGAVAGFVALYIALGRQLPTIKALRAQGAAVAAAGGPPTEEQAATMQQLRGQMATNGQMLAITGAIAVVAMALGA
jgi:uncharacterized membrane protein